MRALAYSHLFRAHGFSVEFVTRLPLDMMDWLERPHRFIGRFVRRPKVKARFLQRATEANYRDIVRKAKDAEIVYFSKVLAYPLIHAIRQATSARLVYDFGDAIWLYDDKPEELHSVLRAVDAVTTDNELTAEYVRRFNENCVVIPDAPQIEEFDRHRERLSTKPTDRFVLGWLGSPGTCYNLFVVWEALEELFRRHPHLHLRLVGTSNDLRFIPPFERVRYSICPQYDQSKMIEEVFGMHVGLFPLQDVEKCRVRGVLKATVYMSGEAAVVCSPVGQSAELIEEGHNGLLAGSSDEWVEKLDALIRNDELRRRLVHGGIETVRSRFRLEDSFLKLKDVLLGDRVPFATPVEVA